MKAAELREFMVAVNPESVPNIEQARAIIDERDRHARERKEAHDEARIEAGYSHGDDYVSQTRAAMRDHRRRQRDLEDRPAHSPNEERAPVPKKDDRNDNGEMTDTRQRRLNRLAAINEELNRARDRTEDDPDKQREAPGGGHTRSR
jgi:hypothetical protein